MKTKRHQDNSFVFDPDKIQAIPTIYKGVQLKSRMEAQCCVLFEKLGWTWEYERFSFMLAGGTPYIPDFWIPEAIVIAECRGYESDKGERQINKFAAMIEAGYEHPDEGGISQYLVIGPESVVLYDGDRDKKYHANKPLSRRPWHTLSAIIALCRCGWRLSDGDCLWCAQCETVAMACLALSVDAGKIFVNGSLVEDFEAPKHPNPLPPADYSDCGIYGDLDPDREEVLR